MRAVVLGGYGLIGAACLRGLKAEGFDILGVGRSRAAALRCDATVPWIIADLTTMTADDWRTLLADADVVVNAAGALQDGARDTVAGIHDTAVRSMVGAIAGSRVRVVQISAVGASLTAATEFLRSKARGEAALTASGIDWVILRPTLVIARDAYGGTALLRAAAALPLVGPRLFTGALLQTVAVEDVAAAVVAASCGRIAPGTIADLTEDSGRSFVDTLAAVRRWQGFRSWEATVAIPTPLLRMVAGVADLLGWLGWRSPLRTAAVRTLEHGVTGDATAWIAAGGRPLRSLAETLDAMPATAQERLFARLHLLLPLVVATLSAFWLVSGMIGFQQRVAAEAVLTGQRLTAPSRPSSSSSARPSTARSASRCSGDRGRDAPRWLPWSWGQPTCSEPA